MDSAYGWLFLLAVMTGQLRSSWTQGGVAPTTSPRALGGWKVDQIGGCWLEEKPAATVATEVEEKASEEDDFCFKRKILYNAL